MRTNKQPQPDPHIFFTLSTVRLLKDALCTLEKALLQEVENLPNVPFAKEVLSQLKNKLDNIMQMEEWEQETPLDYNEVRILYAAVHMHLVALKFSHQEHLMTPCIALCKQFRWIIEYADSQQRAE